MRAFKDLQDKVYSYVTIIHLYRFSRFVNGAFDVHYVTSPGLRKDIKSVLGHVGYTLAHIHYTMLSMLVFSIFLRQDSRLS